MRTSLTELQQAVRYLQHKLGAEEHLLYEARLLTDAALRNNLNFLRKTLTLLKFYHRRQLKQAAENIHYKLLSDPGKQHFRKQLQSIFGE